MYPIWSIGHIFYKWPTKQCWWLEVCLQFKTFYISGWSCKDPVEVHLFWLSAITAPPHHTSTTTITQLFENNGRAPPAHGRIFAYVPGEQVYHIFCPFSLIFPPGFFPCLLDFVLSLTDFNDWKPWIWYWRWRVQFWPYPIQEIVFHPISPVFQKYVVPENMNDPVEEHQ